MLEKTFHHEILLKQINIVQKQFINLVKRLSQWISIIIMF